MEVTRKSAYHEKEKGLEIKNQNALIFQHWASGEKLGRETEKEWAGRKKIRTDRTRETKQTETFKNMKLNGLK